MKCNTNKKGPCKYRGFRLPATGIEPVQAIFEKCRICAVFKECRIYAAFSNSIYEI